MGSIKFNGGLNMAKLRDPLNTLIPVKRNYFVNPFKKFDLGRADLTIHYIIYINLI